MQIDHRDFQEDPQAKVSQIHTVYKPQKDQKKKLKSSCSTLLQPYIKPSMDDLCKPKGIFKTLPSIKTSTLSVKEYLSP